MGLREFVLDRVEIGGFEKGKAEVVKNFLAAEKFSITEIANFASVPETFVLKVKKV